MRIVSKPTIALFITVSIILIAGCSSNGTANNAPPVGKSLISFDSCEKLAAALASAPVVQNSWDTDSVDGAPQAGGAEGDSSTQSRDTTVEEADIAKEDGSYVYVLHHSGKLMIFSAIDPANISKVGEIELNIPPREMVVSGNLVVALGYTAMYAGGGVVGIGGMEPVAADVVDPYYSTIASIVDVSDRSAPKLIREVKLDGSYVDSRLVGSFMHIITSQWLTVQVGVPPKPELLIPRALDTTFTAEGRTDTVVSTDCSDIYMPDPMRFDTWGDYYPLQTTRVITVDLNDLSTSVGSTVALAAWPTVTASPDRLYLADWDGANDVTALHVFDIATDPSTTSYIGAATFTGMVLNQFSIDEYDGTVRVAATTNRSTPGSDDNDNRVLVFKEDANGISEIGLVTGITPGESIWSARFVGPRGFLVTYLTIDPLITVDLSDPTNPRVAGELEVPGVSTYLEAMDDNHLIAVGLDLADGQTWGGGVALSIFDVTDFANPVLAHRVVVGGEGTEAYSEANSTHKAFAYFPEKGIVAIPLTKYAVTGDGYSSLLYVYRVNADTGFQEALVVDHEDLIPPAELPEWGLYGYAMRRALLVGNTLFSLSDYGIKAHDADDLVTLLFEEYLGIEQPDYSGGIGL